MEYKGYYYDEIMQVIEGMERHVDGLKFSSSLYDTRNLCRLFLTTTIQRVRGLYGALSSRDWLVFSSAMRTVIEGIVDQYYIALSNDRDINRLFADYYKLCLYWHCRYIEHYRTQIPKIKADYDKYVFEHLATKVNPKPKSKQRSRLTTATEIHDTIKNTYSKSWSGLTFYGRINAVIALIICPSKPSNPAGTFDRTYSEVSREVGADFQNLSYSNQLDLVIDRLCANNGITRDQIDRDIDPLIELGQFFYRTLSNYIHTTPFSVIPQFNADEGKYSTKWRFGDKALRDAEQQLYLVLTSAAYAFAMCFDAADAQRLRELVEEQTRQCPRLIEWVIERRKRQHAARTGDK